MEHTSSTDDQIKRTFDMLVERISNLEEIALRQHRAAVFEECRKFGELNKVQFGCPFTIIRRRPYSPAPTPFLQLPPNPPPLIRHRFARPSMLGVFVDIATLAVNCTCIEDTPLVYETVVGSEVAEKTRHIEHRLSHEVGWMDSRFMWAEDEAIQQLLDTIFEDSQFRCTHIQRAEFGIKCYVSVRALPRTSLEVPIEDPPLVQLDQFIQQIPKLVKATRHRSVNCISEVVITATSGGHYLIHAVEAIQKADNLPDGRLKDHWKKERCAYMFSPTLANERTLIEVAEVSSFLRSIGKR